MNEDGDEGIQDFVLKLGGKKELGRSRRKPVDTIKLSVREIGFGDVDWPDLVHDRDWRMALVNPNFRVP
jgi:hypothetical protein